MPTAVPQHLIATAENTPQRREGLAGRLERRLRPGMGAGWLRSAATDVAVLVALCVAAIALVRLRSLPVAVVMVFVVYASMPLLDRLHRHLRGPQ